MQFAGFCSLTWKEELNHVSGQKSDCYLSMLESFERQQQGGFSVKPQPIEVMMTSSAWGILYPKVETFCQSYNSHQKQKSKNLVTLPAVRQKPAAHCIALSRSQQLHKPFWWALWTPFYVWWSKYPRWVVSDYILKINLRPVHPILHSRKTAFGESSDSSQLSEKFSAQYLPESLFISEVSKARRVTFRDTRNKINAKSKGLHAAGLDWIWTKNVTFWSQPACRSFFFTT